jgi:predicted secreted hydrolase
MKDDNKMMQVTAPGFRLAVFGAIFLLAVRLASAAADGVKWNVAQPHYAWSFPQDHWARAGYKTEWWYFTGHLQAENGRRFGYQFTFFRIGVLPAAPALNSDWRANNAIMGHAAVSDLSAREHRFSEVFYRAVPLLGGFGSYPDAVLAWSRGPAGTDADWRLLWNGEAFDFEMQDAEARFGFSLSTRPAKPLIFQGPNGWSRKGEGASAASQYYSFTRLATTGQVTVDGKTYRVTGQSWMDKEFGSNQLGKLQVGWDWFSLQLDDQREIMLYLLRDQKGNIDFAGGTVVQPDSQVQFLSQDAFTITVQERWKSANTSGVYPSRWVIAIPGENVEVEVMPEMADQENRSRLLPKLYYWEGAVIIRQDGKSIGKGYVELTGYGTSSRPAI